MNPRVFDLVELSRDSVFHSFDSDYGVYLKNQIKKVPIYFVNKLNSEKSNPKKRALAVKALAKKWLMNNRDFKYIDSHYSKIKNGLVPLVVNYEYLDILYKYVKTPMADYNSWWNKQNTLWAEIDHICDSSERQHFIKVKIEEVPGRSILNIYLDKFNVTMTKIFDTSDKLFILSIWRWIHLEYRDTSTLKDLKEDNFNKINLLLENKNGNTTLLNLGYLNSWIKGQKNRTEFEKVKQYRDSQVGMMFLRGLMALTDQSYNNEYNENVTEVLEDLDNKKKDDQNIEHELMEEVSSKEIKDETIEDLKKDLNIDYKIEVNTDDVDILENKSSIVQLEEEMVDLDIINETKLADKKLILDKTTGTIINSKEIQSTNVKDISDEVYKRKDYNETITDGLNVLIKSNIITPISYNKALKNIDAYSSSQDPYGSEVMVKDLSIKEGELNIEKDKIQIKDSDVVLDKSMLECSLLEYDKKYIKDIMKKDVVNMVNGIQQAGIVIKKYNIEKSKTILGDYETHTVSIDPINGSPSTLKFRLPVIKETGTFKSNGNEYRMRKQRVDLPIRKTKEDTVGLSSYYGKLFITRSVKKANNSIEWIKRRINIFMINDVITNVKLGNSFNKSFKTPFLIQGLSKIYLSFKFNEYMFMFNRKHVIDSVPSDVLKLAEVDKRVVGYCNKDLLCIDYDGNFHTFNPNKPLVFKGSICDILGLDIHKMPLDVTEIKIFNKYVHLGVLLGYYLGLTNLLKLLKIEYTSSEERPKILNTKFTIKFSDRYYSFNRKDKVASMLLYGFKYKEKYVSKYSHNDFNTQSIYLDMFTELGLKQIHIREINLLNKLFIDPITYDVLKSINEPVTFIGLLIRSNELLINHNHKDLQDITGTRIRGYERMPGAIYKELSTNIRKFNNSNIANKSKVDMGHFDVFNSIMSDPSIKTSDIINPIQNLKEAESVTFLGTGGRNPETITKDMRIFHKSDIGIMSEATPDSGLVAVNTFLSANPNIDNLRGVVSKSKDITNTSQLNTSSLIAPSSVHDDPVRTNFINIMNSQTISSDVSEAPYVRTGYESVIGERTGSMFSQISKGVGVVKSKNKTGVIIEYTDEEKKESIGYPLGDITIRVSDSIYPHALVTPLNEGDKVDIGDVISFNTSYFEEDMLNPKKIVLKMNSTVKTALSETNSSFEDSSGISKHMSEITTINEVKLKSVIVNFEQEVHDVVKIGDDITPNDKFMFIEDEITSNTKLFNRDSLDALKELSKQTPKSKYLGTILKLEVYYNGDKNDMSETIKKLADINDRNLSSSLRSTNSEVVTGRVTSDYRVNGTPLAKNTAEIRIYTKTKSKYNVGDKGIFGNQLKSVVGEIMEYEVHTEQGDPVDAIFSSKDIGARKVLSPYKIGSTISLLKVIAKKAVNIYKGN